ncbi:hypothetical protein SJ05684_c20720 [Sinorhizobium sojae CCBAU 05684]|uniref:Uncharacterized protein n=1 Tax=Sinorhizobium sojae CCBAU 05684 TaxID=716928 RepID=A0A249PC58_9HYPH|nr:hypothetical protein SJ05684_c20720 [Sinorhizobium sojae CCBAU 05684]
MHGQLMSLLVSASARKSEPIFGKLDAQFKELQRPLRV